MKQIKLSDTHYIVMDETREITKDHWCLVTHSTQPIESVVIDVTPNGDPIESYEYNRIKEYPLSLAKEIAGEVDVDEKAYKYAVDYRCPATNDQEYCKHDIISAYNNGYNQCLEDNKDKKYTEEDMRKAMSQAFFAAQENYNITSDEIIQSLQPPTEVEVEIVEGKLKRK